MTTIARRAHRWWKKVAWALCIWQTLVFALAGLCYLTGLGTKVPAIADSEQREIASLLQPAVSDQQQSLSEVNKLFETHQRATQLWQEAINELLEGKNPDSVLPKLEAHALRSPKFYDSYTRWLLTDFWRKTRGELLITAAGYGCTSKSVLKTAQLYPYQSWCGTCLESYRWEETTDLLLGAIQAGPIFFAAHLVIFPRRNWFLWLLILFGGAWMWRSGRKMRRSQ